MATIASVEFHNYKTHKYAKIEFTNLVTIIGLSDAGKSNILTGIDMVVLNKPFPASHIHLRGKGPKSGEVVITYTDGRRISRERDGTKQLLTLTHADGKSETYKTFKDCDDIVADFTGFRRVSLDNKSKGECIQIVPLAQSNEPFLIAGNTPAVTLRRISMLAAGAQIEAAKMSLESAVRSRKGTINEREAVVEAIEGEIADLEAPEWGRLATAHNTMKDLIEKQVGTNDELDDLETTFEELPNAIKARADVEQITMALSGIYECQRTLQSMKSEYEIADATKARLQSVISELTLTGEAVTTAETAVEEAEAVVVKAKAACELKPCDDCGLMALGERE